MNQTPQQPSLTDLAYSRMARIDPPRAEPLVRVRIRTMSINHVHGGVSLDISAAVRGPDGRPVVHELGGVKAMDVETSMYESDVRTAEREVDELLQTPEDFAQVQSRLAGDLKVWLDGGENRTEAEFPGSFQSVFAFLHRRQPRAFLAVTRL